MLFKAEVDTRLWALHELSLAVAYGGYVFAKTSLKPALKNISSSTERSKVMECVWTRFLPIDLAAHAIFTATWIHGRDTIKRRYTSRSTDAFVCLKDVFIGGALATGVANAAVGKAFKRAFPSGFPTTPTGEPAPEAPRAAHFFHKYFEVMGPVHKVFLGGSIALGPAIGISVFRTARHPLLARLFGG